MKKLLFSIIILFWINGIQAQVSAIKVDASKVYEKGTRTTYMTLSSAVDMQSAKLIGAKMEGYEKIHRFSYYTNKDFSKIMFTADVSLTDDDIIKILNRELAAIPEVIKTETEEQTPKKEIKKIEKIDVNRIEIKQLKQERQQ
ncbi:MAG: hypothetical protein JXR58_07165 [Bacteroidales bacterium]|nr:hypothetical protein [Bacteroidales bacterium]